MHVGYVLDPILQRSVQGMCHKQISRLQRIGVWSANGTLPMCHKIASTQLDWLGQEKKLQDLKEISKEASNKAMLDKNLQNLS